MDSVNIQQAQHDLEILLVILPEDIRQRIESHGRGHQLIEVVMDYGRRPAARYHDGEMILREEDVTQEEIDAVVAGVGDFDDDNRAGLARTLHRISAIRNRRGHIVGLTCRVGRAVYGTSDIVSDIIEEGHSLLLLGRPGVGKTTILREVARILAEKRRVVIVDTSNEIGGDGDIPHRAVGRARRMQVPKPAFQHETMIEAVENHNPEVIIIDEIGREAEALAARTINERGVQLVGTAHGNTLDNLLLNPTLSDLVGGIESVTLSDDEARRRGTQKTVLERRAPPTFDVVIEIQDRERLVVHRNVTEAVDHMLYGEPVATQLRYRDETGKLFVEESIITELPSALSGRRGMMGGGGSRGASFQANPREVRGRVVPRQSTNQGPAPAVANNRELPYTNGFDQPPDTYMPPRRSLGLAPLTEATEDGKPRQSKPLRVYSYGVARNRLYQAARHLGINIEIAENVHEADVLVTLKNYYRRRRRLISDAEQKRIPVYVLRANTINQMEGFLAEATGAEAPPPDPFEEALDEAREAIGRVMTGVSSVDLRPADSYVRRQQHDLARQFQLVSHSYGDGTGRHVRIFAPR